MCWFIPQDQDPVSYVGGVWEWVWELRGAGGRAKVHGVYECMVCMSAWYV